jgi:hypothetical protein
LRPLARAEGRVKRMVTREMEMSILGSGVGGVGGGNKIVGGGGRKVEGRCICTTRS